MATRKKAKTKAARKIGMAPGSLVHVGEIKTATPSIHLIAYDGEGVDEQGFSTVDASRDYKPSRANHWLNVYGLQDPAIMDEIGRRFHLHPLVMEDILNTHQRSKIEDYGKYLYCVVRLFQVDEATGELKSDQISIVLGHGFVLTFQERRTGVFDPVRERLRAARSAMRQRGTDYLAYALLDAVVDRYFEVADNLDEQADQMEDDALDRPTPALLRRINNGKHDTAQVRRAIWPLREVLNNLVRGDNNHFSAETRLYLRDIYDHAVHVLETLESVRDRLGDLFDIYMSTVSHRLNLEVRVLTVLSMLFMPATLISGIFGMNFHDMPLLADNNGFYVAMALMVGFAILMGAMFWRRNMLREPG